MLSEVTLETGIDTDAPVIGFRELAGTVNSDLTVGVDVTKAVPLLSNQSICHDGVKLHGKGFIVSQAEAKSLGLDTIPDLQNYIRPYVNGRDLSAIPRGLFVLDLFGLDEKQVRGKFPAVYQHLLSTMKIEREKQFAASPTKDSESYAKLWWIFGKPRQEMRPALSGIQNYIATVDTARHRVFQFLICEVVCVDKVVMIADDDPYSLGVLSSKIHVTWSLRAGGWLGVGNDSVYTKTRTFDPFPFPDASEPQKSTIRVIAEELDAHRKCVLAEHPHLTLTGLYNVLERLRLGTKPADLDPKQRAIFDDGLVLILKELHDRLDVAVADAYGWPVDLPEEDLLARLVALNRERAAEEKHGLVRWLRPDYQIPRFGSEKEKARQLEADLGGSAEAVATGVLAAFPKSELEQTVAVMAALAHASGPLDAATIAASFRPGRNVRSSVADVLVALYRMGQAASSDGGRTFALRRAA